MSEKPAVEPSGPDRELFTSRVLDAPRERVTNTFHEFDLKPGGRCRFVMRGPDGTNFPKLSVFVEVVPPERVVFDHVSGPRFEMAITFEEHDGKTRVGWRQAFNTAVECRRVATFAVPANEQNLDRLAMHVAGVG